MRLCRGQATYKHYLNENNSPVKYQCRENGEMLVSVELERQCQ